LLIKKLLLNCFGCCAQHHTNIIFELWPLYCLRDFAFPRYPPCWRRQVFASCCCIVYRYWNVETVSTIKDIYLAYKFYFIRNSYRVYTSKISYNFDKPITHVIQGQLINRLPCPDHVPIGPEPSPDILDKDRLGEGVCVWKSPLIINSHDTREHRFATLASDLWPRLMGRPSTPDAINSPSDAALSHLFFSPDSAVLLNASRFSSAILQRSQCGKLGFNRKIRFHESTYKLKYSR